MPPLPANFAGPVRLFPLPNLVFFPHVIQPLHIFEPRYCDLLEDALASDQLIALALLQPGWEPNYEGRPPIHSVACVGQIISHARLPEQRHNILLQGWQRVRITRELSLHESPKYRQAEVQFLLDEHDPQAAAERGDHQSQLIDLFRRFLPHNAQLEQQLDQLLSRPLDLGALTDIIAYTTKFDANIKQQLLAETNVDVRTRTIIELLEQALQHPELLLLPSQQEFPPPFSAN